MTHPIETRLSEMGLTLPDAPAPAANYVPYVIVGKQLFISGQIAMKDGAFWTGTLGDDMATEDGAVAAQSCALALLAQARAACGGDFDGIKRLVKLVGFVNSTPDFVEQPKVINGASDLMVALMGEAGRHARSAVSAPSLPFGVAVEIEAIFELV